MALASAKPPLKMSAPPEDDGMGADGGDEGSMDPKVQAAKVIAEAFDDGDYEAAADALCSFFDMYQAGGGEPDGDEGTAGPMPGKKPKLVISIGHAAK